MRLSANFLAALLATQAVLASGCQGKAGGGSALKEPDTPPTYEAVLAIASENPAFDQVRDELLRRSEHLAFFIKVGTAGPGEFRKLKIYLYPPTEPEARKQLEALCKAARLDFRKVHPKSATLAPGVAAGKDIVPGYKLFEHIWINDDGETITEQLLLSKRNPLKGSDIKNASADAARAGVINVTLTSKGGQYMRRLTEPMQKGLDRLAIVLNDKVVSAPVVQDTLDSQFIITGIDDDAERKELSSLLQVPLSANLSIESLTALPVP